MRCPRPPHPGLWHTSWRFSKERSISKIFFIMSFQRKAQKCVIFSKLIGYASLRKMRVVDHANSWRRIFSMMFLYINVCSKELSPGRRCLLVRHRPGPRRDTCLTAIGWERSDNPAPRASDAGRAHEDSGRTRRGDDVGVGSGAWRVGTAWGPLWDSQPAG